MHQVNMEAHRADQAEVKLKQIRKELEQVNL